MEMQSSETNSLIFRIYPIATVWLFFLSGCVVGPNYRPPQIKSSAQWNESLAGGETNSQPTIAE